MDIFSILVSVVMAIVAQALSMLWYASGSPFGKQWRAALKRKPEAKIPMKMHAISFAVLLVSSLVYGLVVDVLGFVSWIDMLFFSGFMWLAFWLPGKVTHLYYGGQSRALIWIDGLFYLIVYVLFGLAHAFI